MDTVIPKELSLMIRDYFDAPEIYCKIVGKYYGSIGDFTECGGGSINFPTIYIHIKIKHQLYKINFCVSVHFTDLYDYIVTRKGKIGKSHDCEEYMSRCMPFHGADDIIMTDYKGTRISGFKISKIASEILYLKLREILLNEENWIWTDENSYLYPKEIGEILTKIALYNLKSK